MADITNSTDFAQLAQVISDKVFHGRLPPNSAPEIALAIIEVCLPDEANSPGLHAFFSELANALLAREIAQDTQFVN